MAWEPAAQKVIYGVGNPVTGQQSEVVVRIDDATMRSGDPSLGPVMVSAWLPVPGDPSRWSQKLSDLEDLLGFCTARGLCVNLGMHFHGATKPEGWGGALDREAARGDFDAQMQEAAQLFLDSGVLLYLRIGVELNGVWNGYTPGVFPDAFARGARVWKDVVGEQVRVVATLESPHGADPWALGLMPRDEVVDAYGLDVFHDWQGADLTRQLMQHAAGKGKRVLLGEASPTKQDGMADHDRIMTWWKPLLDLMADGAVEACSLLPVDWANSGQQQWVSWGDSRFEQQPGVWSWWLEALSGQHGPQFVTSAPPQPVT